MNSAKEADPSSSSISAPPEVDPTSSEIDLSVKFLPEVDFMTFEYSKLTNRHLNFKFVFLPLSMVTLKIFLLSRSLCCSNLSGSLK